jgi:hypothetical protein
MIALSLLGAASAASAQCGGIVSGTDFTCPGPLSCDLTVVAVNDSGGCCAACQALPTCTSWSCATGDPTIGKQFACWLKNTTAPKHAGGSRISGFPGAEPPPPPPPPKPYGCLPPHHTEPFCNASLSPQQRATLLAQSLTVDELVACMPTARFELATRDPARSHP